MASLRDWITAQKPSATQNALLRDCRFISAIGLHTGAMTQAQSKRLFMDECYQDEGNATQ